MYKSQISLSMSNEKEKQNLGGSLTNVAILKGCLGLEKVAQLLA